MNDARETAVEEWEAACIEEEIGLRDEFYAALDKQEARVARKLAYIDQTNFEEEIEPIHIELRIALNQCLLSDGPAVETAARARFDAALVRLRELYREFDPDWEDCLDGFGHLPQIDIWTAKTGAGN